MDTTDVVQEVPHLESNWQVTVTPDEGNRNPLWRAMPSVQAAQDSDRSNPDKHKFTLWNYEPHEE